MKLALFDLDDTLLDGDSEVAWCELLAERGRCDLANVRALLADYREGEFDIARWVDLQLGLLASNPLEQLLAWRSELASRMRGRFAPDLRRALAEHARAGHELAIVTAASRFVAEPFAELAGVRHLIATEAELDGDRFTGRALGLPCFREGKLDRVAHWLAARELRLDDVAESWFYSDSHNDLPLLARVTHAIAVRPDAQLAAHAARRGWRVIA